MAEKRIYHIIIYFIEVCLNWQKFVYRYRYIIRSLTCNNKWSSFRYPTPQHIYKGSEVRYLIATAVIFEGGRTTYVGHMQFLDRINYFYFYHTVTTVIWLTIPSH